jgi:hypothetical protein
MSRFLAAALLTTLGCVCALAQEKVESKDNPKSDNKGKILGKWKVVSMTPKDGKEQKLDIGGGLTAILEFTADGNARVGVDASSLSPELKAILEKNPEAAAKFAEMNQVGKYKVSGDAIEFVELKNPEGGPFGKNNKGKLKFDGDTLTLTGDDGILKLTRIKEKKDDKKKDTPEKK